MHELSTVVYVIDTVEKICREQELKTVASVTLEVGEVSTIIPEYLTDFWEWSKKRSEFLKEAELKIEKIKAVTYCQDCKQTYDTMTYKKICPYCGSGNTFLITGNEYSIKEIEAM